MTTILIVEDDPAILKGLSESLRFEGYEVLTAADGTSGYATCLERKPDVVLLDVMLPHVSGVELCRRLRKEGMQKPIIMLTARNQETDKILGLDVGADDYVTKPFSLPELMARLRALLRRTQLQGSTPDLLRFGEAEIDFRRYEARRGGKIVALTRKEFEILRLLAARAGEVITREQLLNDVWGYESFPATRTVDNHIATLRAKLETDPSQPAHIRTVHGIGYRFINDEPALL